MREAPARDFATDKQILELTDVAQKLGVIGGASASAMKAGLPQFSQGLSAGVFRTCLGGQ